MFFFILSNIRIYKPQKYFSVLSLSLCHTDTKVHDALDPLTADVQLQHHDAGASLIEGIAAVGARVRLVDSWD